MFISCNIDSIRNFVTFDFMRFFGKQHSNRVVGFKEKVQFAKGSGEGGIIGTVVDNCIDLVVR